MKNDLRQYRVTWEIDVWAGSAVSAAKKARASQKRRGTTATVFTVQSMDGKTRGFKNEIDLQTPNR